MEMTELENVIRGLRDIDMFIAGRLEHEKAKNFLRTIDETIALLKEQEAMNVDTFVQWCIDSHIMGDATVSGIKYWVGKYKETNESR